ncbi:MAG TPA: hypothetical protein PK490_02465 [Prosthecobacter sp.]|nr:hypothetical protein [Prosthecobacter sp.]HRK13120.1 hypothetical protein [Prosthecobacter sp.]
MQTCHLKLGALTAVIFNASSCVMAPPPGTMIQPDHAVSRTVSQADGQKWRQHLNSSPFSTMKHGPGFTEAGGTLTRMAGQVRGNAGGMTDPEMRGHSQAVAQWCLDTERDIRELRAKIAGIRLVAELAEKPAGRVADAFISENGRSTLLGSFIGWTAVNMMRVAEETRQRDQTAARIMEGAHALIRAEQRICREIGVPVPDTLATNLQSVLDSETASILVGSWQAQNAGALQGMTQHGWQFSSRGTVTVRYADGRVQSGSWRVREGSLLVNWSRGGGSSFFVHVKGWHQVILGGSAQQGTPVLNRFSMKSSDIPVRGPVRSFGRQGRLWINASNLRIRF